MSLVPCLLFTGNAEEAANFYVSVVPNSRIVEISRLDGKPLMVVFELDGTRCHALNGPKAEFTEAISLTVFCDTQEEIDRVWDRLGEGGAPMVCGWIRDRYGVRWQVAPRRIDEWLTGDPAATARVMAEVGRMVKLDIPTLERAWRGEAANA